MLDSICEVLATPNPDDVYKLYVRRVKILFGLSATRPSAGRLSWILYDDPQTLESYINPSHGACDPVGTISGARFCDFRRAGFSLCLVHSRIQIVHQTNTRVRKCTCECKCPKRTLLDNYAPFSPVVNIWNVAQWYLLRILFISLGPCRAKHIFVDQEWSKRWFQKNVPNGL